MIQKLTILKILDTCGVTKAKCIHVYKKKFAKIGDFLKISAQETTKATEKKYKKKKFIALLICTRGIFKKPDSTRISFGTNSCLLIKKRVTPLGKFLKGPSVYNIKRKKLISSFIKII